jgi:CTP:molybdopterin cytidylyltransferase MocA
MNALPRLEGVAGIILSAGISSRMGRDKALLELPGTHEKFVTAQIAALKPHCELVIVVAGANAGSLKHFVYARAAELVVNPDPSRGQFSSLQTGLQAVLDRGRDKALITHVDRVPAASTTFDRLRERYSQVERQGKWLVVPQFAGKHGHPVLAGREMIEAWLRAPIQSTAREVEHQHQDRIKYVDVDDANVTVNVNTPEEYEKLASKT